jgi:succinoglycan biosynthesis transport protein ExoP
MSEQLPLDPIRSGPHTRPSELTPDAIDAVTTVGGAAGNPRPIQPIQPAGSDSDWDVNLMPYVRAVYKRRYLAIAVFLLVSGVVAFRTFAATPVYEASARLLIDAENPNVVGFREVIDEQQERSDYYLTQYNILQSRSLARRTLDSIGGWQHPAFGGSAGPPAPGLVATAREKVYGWFGLRASAPEMTIPAADETTQQSAAIDAFLSQLTISPLRNSRLVDVVFRSTDQDLTARAANAVVDAYIAQALEYKFLASQEATNFLTDRLADQKQQVQAAEVALQRYREQNEAISLEDRENIVVQKLADLSAAVTRAKTLRIEKETVYEQLRGNRNNPALLDTFPAILTNSFIQGLKIELASLQRQKAGLAEKFLASHPQMVSVNTAITNTEAKLATEVEKVVLSVKSEFDAALAQERSLTGALNQQKTEALAMNQKSIEYSVLEREVQSGRQIYDSLMQRSKETGVSGELRTSNIRLVDAAERPQSHAYPQTRLNLMAGAGAGLLLAVLVAVFFEYVDSRIKTPEEIKGYLGLPHLGMLPLMSKPADGVKYVRLDSAVPANFSEAFRVLRTNVLFSSTNDGAQTMLVTSTGPGEGKSLVASNLAISLAQAGKRVLLIDADMRKPKVQDVFGVPAEPGLSNLLVADAKASECVRPSGSKELWVLPAGRIPPNPAELLGSQRFEDLLNSLKSHFDWIIIDTPPVMAVADVSVIAHLVSGTLFVIGAEMTSRHAARTAVQQLSGVQARFVGAVLNRVDLERNSYYYSQYYRREYTTYYIKNAG